ALQAVRRGQPRVVAGEHRLDTPVRWVHAIEFADAARLLRGGELVLATGIALPDEGALLDAYVADLASVGVAALAVELGRRYTGGLPASFVAAGNRTGCRSSRSAGRSRSSRSPRRCTQGSSTANWTSCAPRPGCTRC